MTFLSFKRKNSCFVLWPNAIVLSMRLNELFRILGFRHWIAIYTEVNSDSFLHISLIRKNNQISFWSQRRQSMNQFNRVSFQENKVTIQLKRERNNSNTLTILKEYLPVIKNSFVITCSFRLLGDLT